MLPSIRAPRVSPVALLAVASAAAWALLGPGCGGSGTDSTGAGGASHSAASATSTGEGGFGGELFGSSTSTTGTGGTGGTGGAMQICDDNPTTGPATWAKRFGDANGQFGRAIAMDSQGNVFVTGGFTGALSIPGFSLNSGGPSDNDIFVAKLSPSGQVLWAKSFGDGSKDQGGRAVAVDASGDVIVAGYYLGSVGFGGATFTSTGPNFEDVFIVKLKGSDGSHVWSHELGDISTQVARGLAVDASGNVALVGEFQGALDGTPLSNPDPDAVDAFVVVYDSAGALKWAKQFGDAANDQSAHAVTFDTSGNVYVTGEAAGTIDLGAGALSAPGTSSAFVVKLDGAGAPKWGKIFGQQSSSGEGVAVTADGYVLLTGDHNGEIDFGGGPLPNNNGPNIFVAKLDAQGSHVWSKTFGDDKSQHAYGIAVDGAGRSIVTGSYSGKIDFGGGALTSTGMGVDAYLAKLDTVGCQIWAKTFGDASFQEATGVAMDAAGNAVVTGSISGTVDFGTGALSGAADDVFIAKFGP